MPEIWQEVCLVFASWPEVHVVGLSICGLVLKKITKKQKITKSVHFDTHDFNPSVSPYNNANGF